MNLRRKIYDRLPDRIDIPKSMKDHRVEVLFIDLEDRLQPAAVDEKRNWPKEFFEQTFGAIPDFQDPEPQGEYEEREELK